MMKLRMVTELQWRPVRLETSSLSSSSLASLSHFRYYVREGGVVMKRWRTGEEQDDYGGAMEQRDEVRDRVRCVVVITVSTVFVIFVVNILETVSGERRRLTVGDIRKRQH